MNLEEAIQKLKNHGMSVEKTPLNPRKINGNGHSRKCSICGKVISGPDDCDFTEGEDCTCTACQRARVKKRSKGNKFMESLLEDNI